MLAVLHEPTNQFIYAVGRRGLGRRSINGQILTLTFNTKLLTAGPITGFRDDGADVATDVRLEACRALLATGNVTLSNLATGIGTPADVAPGSDAGAGSLIAKVTRLLLTQSGIASKLTSILAAFAPLASDASVQAGTAKAEAIRALLAGTLKVATPTPASIVTGQVKIAATGTAVALPNVALANGIVVKAKTSNAVQTSAAPGVVGAAGVTTVIDGTGSGYPLAPDEAASFACSNANLVFVNGTAGDVFFYEGN